MYIKTRNQSIVNVGHIVEMRPIFTRKYVTLSTLVDIVESSESVSSGFDITRDSDTFDFDTHAPQNVLLAITVAGEVELFTSGLPFAMSLAYDLVENFLKTDNKEVDRLPWYQLHSNGESYNNQILYLDSLVSCLCDEADDVDSILLNCGESELTWAGIHKKISESQTGTVQFQSTRVRAAILEQLICYQDNWSEYTWHQKGVKVEKGEK